MDLGAGNSKKTCKNNDHIVVPVDGGSIGKEEKEGEEAESNFLLGSGGVKGRGGMAKRQKKAKRKVQWNDRNGNKLVEVLEFQPSDTSDTEDDYADTCICTIM